ncbi:MAG: SCO family protein, partial [Gammaproteobacteria bacterium]
VSLPEDLEGKVLIMDFVYTHCTTVCPVLSALFAGLQGRLGGRLGKEVLLVSVTVDPARDTTERLKRYAERMGAKPGWLWLTGPKPQVKKLLEAAGAYTPDFENHPAMVLVGMDKTWFRFYGFPSAQAVLEKVEACR